MSANDWESVPLAYPPLGAVEVPNSGFGFLAIASLLELGVPNVLFRLPREGRETEDLNLGVAAKEIAAYLAEAGVPGPPNPAADCWFIVPPPSLPTEGFWDALNEAEPLRQAMPGVMGRRDGLRAALQVLYSNS